MSQKRCKTLIFFDRDGTLIYDHKYHLGRTNDWRGKVVFLPGVINGIRALQQLKDARLYMITNQPGVAMNDYPLLTEKRAHQVCEEVLAMAEDRGAKFDGYFLCPHAHPDYVKKRTEHDFEQNKVCTCTCIKPDLGMVFDAIKKESVNIDHANIFVVGDRLSDVETGVHAKGIGVLVPFIHQIDQVNKVRKHFRNDERVYIAQDFADAANFILKHA